MNDAANNPPVAGREPGGANPLVELSVLTGGLAHEIRNSLSTMTVNLQLLDEDWGRIDASPADDAELAREALEVARRGRKRIGTLLVEARRLESILNDFLQFVNLRAMNLRVADLAQVVGDVAEFFRPQAESNGIALSLSTPDGPLPCRVDVNLIKQAILNLLLNAQQAMPEGGSLDIRVERAGTDAHIMVRDTGVGIEPENVSRVFEAYYSTRKAGTGLGLPTTRRIVEEHGGRVDVESTPRQGTVITICLPLNPN